MARPERLRPPLSDSGPPLSPLPEESAPITRPQTMAALAVLLLFISLAGFHASIAPMNATGYQNAPDEAAHVRYVRTVMSGRLPTRFDSMADPAGYEWHQPPLYYVLDAPFLAVSYRAARWLSILCGAASILTVFLAARLVFPRAYLLAIVAASLAALLPTHIAICSTVNNDPMLEALFSLEIYVLLLSMRSGFTFRRAVAAGVLLGLGLLTKGTAIVLLPVVLTAAALMAAAGQPARLIAARLAVVGAVAAAASGWWFARNVSLYGQPLPVRAFQESFAGTAMAADMASQMGSWSAYAQLVVTWTYQSFWAVYGTARDSRVGMPRFLPAQLYQLTVLLAAAAFAGLIRAHFRRRRDFSEFQRHSTLLLFSALIFVAGAFAVFVSHYFQTQARYIYPAMLPISLLFAVGWRAIFPERYYRASAALLVSLLAFMCVIYLNYVVQSVRT